MQMSHAESRRITGSFSPDFQQRVGERLALEAVQAGLWKAIHEGRLTRKQVYQFAAKKGIPLLEGGANGFYITNAEAVSMLTDHFVGIDAGTAAVIQIYSGSVPADADAANGGTLLATCTASASAAASIADDTPGALATFDTITADSSADNTGTAAFFRISTQSAGTVTDQGTVGTSSADLIFNTVAFTSGSEISITSFTILLPEGP